MNDHRQIQHLTGMLVSHVSGLVVYQDAKPQLRALVVYSTATERETRLTPIPHAIVMPLAQCAARISEQLHNMLKYAYDAHPAHQHVPVVIINSVHTVKYEDDPEYNCQYVCVYQLTVVRKEWLDEAKLSSTSK